LLFPRSITKTGPKRYARPTAHQKPHAAIVRGILPAKHVESRTIPAYEG